MSFYQFWRNQRSNLNCILKIGFNSPETNVYIYFKFLIYIFAYTGETSSGKSTIVNAIIGKKILPTGIEATTTRVCRVKYSKELKISTCSGTDKEYKHTISFTSPEEMADKLKFIAQTNDKNITYVDICMPIPFQQVHVHLYMCYLIMHMCSHA